MKYLLDTCLISELPKPVPNQKVIGWLKKILLAATASVNNLTLVTRNESDFEMYMIMQLNI
ncbi:MAG: hypothetical protein BWK80_11260 [Desulfobacteraceae bacterium IS3]|nr:MAG: hypothetical protein BWK80_11260 [Desulfobacteraceae bacterium IS3]